MDQGGTINLEEGRKEKKKKWHSMLELGDDKSNNVS